MKYLLALYDDETRDANATEAEMGELFSAYMAFNELLNSRNAHGGGEPLEPSHKGAHLLQKDGKTEIHDGPFVDSKEQLGGFYIIEAPDLDAALDLAAQCPCALTGTVEVRPIWEIGG
jgi:hypothetical protein